MNQKTKKRYIFYGHGRTGSSLLGRYINQHPEAHFDGELYYPEKLKSLPIWKRLIARNTPRFYLKSKVNSCQKRCYGFSFLFYQFVSTRATIEMMSKWGWKIIHLKRDNSFDQVMSNQVAHLRNKWHTLSDDTSLEKNQSQVFEVDKDDALVRLKHILDVNRKQEEEMSLIPHITVHYERDLAQHSQHQQTLNRVFDFLELEHFDLESPKLLKTFNKPYSEIVSNYDEVKNAAIEAGLIKPIS